MTYAELSEVQARRSRQFAEAQTDAMSVYCDAERDLKDLQAENDRLRELVWDLYCLAYPSTVEWEVADETYDKYSPCEKCHELHGGKSPCASTAKDMTEECCAPIQANVVADRMRDLGVSE